jgi:hypothetical protein
MNNALPRWADLVLLPLVSLSGRWPWPVGWWRWSGRIRLRGDFRAGAGRLWHRRGLSYTLYYATTFVFTGLAVAVAFHGGLFNIGGEGQAVMGGLGTGLVALWWSAVLPAWLMLPLMMLRVPCLAWPGQRCRPICRPTGAAMW